MKFAVTALLLLASTGAAFAQANPPQGLIQHVIIVIQENRTPTNLFFADQTLVNNGAHVTGVNNSGTGACDTNSPNPVGRPDHEPVLL